MAFKDSDIEASAWYTVEQTAEFLGVTTQTVRRHIKVKKLRSRKMRNRRHHVEGESIREFLNLDNLQ